MTQFMTLCFAVLLWSGVAAFDTPKKRLPPVNCIEQPTQPNCTDYHYPYAMKDVELFCSHFPTAPGCTIKTVCDLMPVMKKNSVYCDPFHVLKMVCLQAMSEMEMKMCKNYTMICDPGSKVKECNVSVIPLPHSDMLAKSTTMMCTKMPMAPCFACNLTRMNMTHGKMMPMGNPHSCNLLGVYSQMCMMMPDMEMCKSWHMMCMNISSWPLCKMDDMSGMDMGMMMYFHQRIGDYILFKEWMPGNTLQYTLSLIAIIVMSVFYEGIKLTRELFEGEYSKKKKIQERKAKGYMVNTHERDESETGTKDTPCPHHLPVVSKKESRLVSFLKFYLLADLIRFTLVFIQVIFAYVLMLIAMTYNIGLFFAVCFGAAIGGLLFHRIKEIKGSSDSGTPMTESCH